MSNEDESHDEAQLLVQTVARPMQSLRPPIDYIDLIQDTPLSTRLWNNGTNTRLVSLSTENRKSKSSKRSQQLVPDEVIDLNDSPEADAPSVCYINDSDRDESVKLTCPVCLEKLSSKLKPTAPRCGHIFCAACLQDVVRTTKKCPLCQARVAAKSFVRLYF